MLTGQLSLRKDQQNLTAKQDEEYQTLATQRDDFLSEKRLSQKLLAKDRAELEKEYLFFQEEQRNFSTEKEHFKSEETKSFQWLRSEEVSLPVIVSYKMTACIIILAILTSHFLTSLNLFQRIVLGKLMKI